MTRFQAVGSDTFRCYRCERYGVTVGKHVRLRKWGGTASVCGDGKGCDRFWRRWTRKLFRCDEEV